jgi:hypothetical protein
VWTAAAAVLLAIGIALGSSIGSPQATTRVVTEQVAPRNAHAEAASPHSRAGAVATAARAITAFSGSVLLDPTRLREVVARIAASSSRPQLTEAFEEASAQTRAKLGASTVPRPVIVLRAVPVGYRIERYSPEDAMVAVWYVGVVGSGATVQPQQSWRTQTVSLAWQHGGWKVASFASSTGPTPTLATQSDTPAVLFAAIPRFQEFAYAAH